MSCGSCQLIHLILLCCALQRIHCHDITGKDATYCNISCKSRLHTMCDLGNPQRCSGHLFLDYGLNELDSSNLRERLVQGHNGIRDRIARRMNVSNMIALSWDFDLAHMASKYANFCTPFEDDECMQFNETFEYKERILHFYMGQEAHKFIAQNRFCLQAKYFPKIFVELALRNWYFEKNVMERPERHVDARYKVELGIIKNENNFTHLAFPFTYRFGCSLSRIDGYYCLICNYYPYYRSENNTMIFESGKPTSRCPTFFPLKKSYFRHLCSNKNNAVQIASISPLPLAVCIISIVLLC